MSSDDEYHIVIESPKDGFSRQRAYMATLDKLRNDAWQYRGDVKHYRLDAGVLTRGPVVDETGSVVETDFANWDVGGNDARVSVEGYPSTKKVQVLGS